MAKTGDTIVALVADEATVKYLKKRGDQHLLEPANPNYQPIPVDDRVSIIGRVISVIRKLN